MWDYLRLSLKNVRRGRIRSILTVSATAVGIAAVVLLGAIGQCGKYVIRTRLEAFGINGIMVFSGDYGGLTVADANRICQRIPEVVDAMPFETGVCYYTVYNRRAMGLVLGVDAELDRFMQLEMLYGRNFSRRECATGARVCMVDSNFAMTNFKRLNIVGQTVAITRGNTTEEYTIIGVADSSLSDLSQLLGVETPAFLSIPYTCMVEDASAGVSQLAVTVEENADAEPIAERIRQLLKKTNTNGAYFQVENMSGHLSKFDGLLDSVIMALRATAAVSLLVAGLGIANTMLATVTERRGEIGICKAIGAQSGQIMLIFMAEAVSLSLLGGLVGVAFGGAVSMLGFAILKLPLTLDLSTWLLPWAVAIGVGVLAGVVPAGNAAKLPPVVAMRKD